MKKNRILAFFITVAMCTGAVCGCGSTADHAADIISEEDNLLSGGNENPTDESSVDKTSIVCTTFPQYDWVKQLIAGAEDSYDVELLLDNGMDLHNYQPTAQDMMKIADCDMFIYVGGESDAWVTDALKESTNNEQKVINMVESLGDAVVEEELAEGMQEEHHDEEEEHHDEEEPEIDEHIWLSLNNAKILVETIGQNLADIKGADVQLIQSNCENYLTELEELSLQYEETVQGAERHTILFGDRFPFRYLTEDYELTYYAAFVGCSAETEASFETIAFLAGKMDELDLPVIFTIENSDGKIAQSILNNTSNPERKIVTMNSMQSATVKDIENGASYLSIMEDNLAALKEGLY